MFTCNFCLIADDNNTWFDRYGFCEECEKVRNLSKVYTMKALTKTLETIYLREEEQIELRADAVKSGVSLRSGKWVKPPII
jgi:DNA topoisomerase IB